MFGFLTIYMVVYGGANLMFVLKARAAFQPGLYLGSLIGFWCTLMVVGPMLVHTLEGKGHEGAATAMAYTGYTWMGLMLVFLTVALLCDTYWLLAYLARALNIGGISALSARAAFFIPAITAALINAYGFHEAWDIKLKHVEVPTSKITVPKLRVVQISDVHLGLMVGPRKLAKIAALVREADPDVLVCTGDLVDGTTNDISGMMPALAAMTARYGKFAITGNHEMYAGIENSIRFTEGGGFRMLRDEVAVIPNAGLSVIGEDYRRAGWDMIPKPKKPFSETELYGSAPKDGFRLLLKHVPIIDDAVVGKFDLQLSGHTHAGQIFPFYIPVRMVFKYIAGLYDLGKGSMLYTSRGTGTWGPTVRFLSPPEVTVIDLVRK